MLLEFLEFVVNGTPVPKGRPRVLRSGRAYTPRRTLDYERKVRLCAMAAAAGRKPVAGPVGIKIVFRALRRATSRPDLDNLIKSVKDALNGVAYIDDAQVVRLIATKEQCERGEEATLVSVESE